MNLHRVARRIQAEWEDKIDFDVEFDDDNDKVTLSETVHPKAYDDHILFSVEIYDAGDTAVMYLEFCFDELEITRDSLRLVNAFNDKSLFLKAQIDLDEPTYLRVVYNVKYVQEENVLDHVNFALSELVDKDLVPYLKSLTMLTE